MCLLREGSNVNTFRAYLSVCLLLALGMGGCADQATQPAVSSPATQPPGLELGPERAEPLRVSLADGRSMEVGALHNAVLESLYLRYRQKKPSKAQLPAAVSEVLDSYARVDPMLMERFTRVFGAARPKIESLVDRLDTAKFGARDRSYLIRLLAEVESAAGHEKVESAVMEFCGKNGWPQNEPYISFVDVLLASNDFWNRDAVLAKPWWKRRASLVIAGDAVGSILGGLAGAGLGWVAGGPVGTVVGTSTGSGLLGGAASIALNETLPE